MKYVVPIMKDLEPDLTEWYTSRQLQHIIAIAKVIANSDGLSSDTLNLGTALLSLDLLVKPERSNISSQEIGDVSESYSGNTIGYSKWRQMYDSLLNGTADFQLSLHYVGV